MKHSLFKQFINWYPPYIGAGVKVRELSPDYRFVHVEMKLRWFNRNYVGTHFGGNLYAMTDPFYMLLLMNVLGKEYLVWDKSAHIDFIKPGKGVVSARFELTDERLGEIYRNTESGEKYLPEFEVNVRDEDGELVARVLKTLYIRKQSRRR